jgi:hypothetical protein
LRGDGDGDDLIELFALLYALFIDGARLFFALFAALFVELRGDGAGDRLIKFVEFRGAFIFAVAFVEFRGDDAADSARVVAHEERRE